MARLTVTQKREDEASKAEMMVDEAKEIITGLFTELDEIKSNMEEKFSSTDKFARLEELVGSLEWAMDSLEGAQSAIPTDFQYT